MKITLNWTNINTGSFTTRIYRSLTPIDKSALGTPLVTLTNGENTYVDNDVEYGFSYYYCFETIKGENSIISRNYYYTALPRRGPGPVDIQIGDFKLGYYGSIPAELFITPTQLMVACDLSGLLTINTITSWHKWVRNGKICFIPDQPISYKTNDGTVSWKTFYDRGLALGIDGTHETIIPNIPLVNQNKRITIGNDTFIVRLMTGIADELTDFTTIYDGSAIAEPYFPNTTNEYDDFILPLYLGGFDCKRFKNIYNYNTFFNNNCFTKNLYDTNRSIERGAALGTTASTSLTCITVTNTLSEIRAYAIWRPVLELVEGN